MEFSNPIVNAVNHYKMNKTTLFLTIALLWGLVSCTPTGQVEVKNLRLEMKKDPMGIDVSQPRFSWQISSKQPDLTQVAYQIQVATSPEELVQGKNLYWDSGTVSSDQSILIPYSGKDLESEKPYYWRVQITTNQGKTAWSKPAQWSMAILNPADWKANWIGEDTLSNPNERLGDDKNQKTRLAARYFRKEFTADKEVKRATLYISGLGSSETYLNGQKISEDIFAPIPSMYNKRVYYNTYDVTPFIQKAGNTLGVIVGNGRYLAMRNPGMVTFGLPSLLAQLKLEYADGSQSTLLTDTSWKVTSKGPIVANNEFDGEEYDARLEMEDWKKNGFNDAEWKNVDIMPTPAGELTAQQAPNIRIQDTVKPISITARPDGKYIVDMGQNMVGWLKVHLKGKEGQPIKMVFAELLKEDGSLYLDNLRSAQVTDIYTPARDGDFNWHPSFVYHGFRFVEVSGLDYQPAAEDFTGEVFYDEMATTGNFESSQPLLNQLHRNAFWGIRGNYRGMPTDCPQRDERLGWLGDRTTGAYGEAFLLDNSQLYNKWLQDIEDSMTPEGSISDVSPAYWQLYSDNVTWPAAFFCVADMLYRQYGDDSSIRAHYPAMKRWMNRIQEVSMKDYIITKDTYGDWCMPPEKMELIHSQDPARKTDGAILSTTVYYDLLKKMANFARICGQDADVQGYEELAAKMKEAYNNRFFNKETAQYGNNTVTANILSLRLGLVPDGYQEKVFANIIEKTEKDFNGHVSTGVLGIQHLMRGLTERGRTDLALKIATNETYPSWGYMIKNGATTIWELWNGNTADPAMNSANHVMLLGDLLIWYYEDLAGIKCAPDAIGFKKILMAPVFPEGLTHVNASYQSAYGEIKSDWTNKDGKLSWEISIPGNTSAIVRIPKAFNVNQKTKEQKGVRQVSETEEYTEIEVGSGNYRF